MDNKKSCNSNIQCTVNSCAYHNPQNYCSLSQIKVGCTDASLWGWAAIWTSASLTL